MNAGTRANSTSVVRTAMGDSVESLSQETGVDDCDPQIKAKRLSWPALTPT